MAALAAGLLSAVPASAFGQSDADSKTIPSLEYQQADVREALEALFKDVGVSYSIAPEVQGQVTVSLHNITFSTALQNILRQVDATYRITGGTYEIVKRSDPLRGGPDPDPVLEPMTEVVRRIKVLCADPELIAILLSAKGNQSYTLPPEISSLRKGASNGAGGMGGLGGGLGGGSMGGGLGGGSMGSGLGGGSMGGGSSNGFGGGARG